MRLARSRRLAGLLLTFIGTAIAFPGSLAAQGDLLIAPTRLVLDGRQGGEVILSNVGSEEATYRISLELRRMTPEGNLEPVETAEANATEAAALEMIRYAPRRVVLPPGEPQAIRVSARPGADLPDGEYRAHLSFAALPKVKPLEAEEASPTEGFTLKITPVYGITMPIIIRKGAISVVAGLANPRIVQTDEGPAFAVDISRNGDASIYGDLLVYGPQGDEPLFVARGLGVYPEIESRHTTFALSPEQAAAMRGQVKIELREPLSAGAALITSVDTVLR